MSGNPPTLDESAIDAVCDCLSAAIAIGLPVAHLPRDSGARRTRIDQWRRHVTDPSSPPPPGGERFAAACDHYARTGHGGDALNLLTQGPRARRSWRRRLRPIGGYLITLWVLGALVWWFTSAAVGGVIRDVDAGIRPVSALPAQGGVADHSSLWIPDLATANAVVAIAAVLLTLGIAAWWPILGRLIERRSVTQPSIDELNHGAFLEMLPTALILLLGGPVVLAVMLALFVPLFQLYRHMAVVVSS